MQIVSYVATQQYDSAESLLYDAIRDRAETLDFDMVSYLLLLLAQLYINADRLHHAEEMFLERERHTSCSVDALFDTALFYYYVMNNVAQCMNRLERIFGKPISDTTYHIYHDAAVLQAVCHLQRDNVSGAVHTLDNIPILLTSVNHSRLPLTFGILERYASDHCIRECIERYVTWVASLIPSEQSADLSRLRELLSRHPAHRVE